MRRSPFLTLQLLFAAMVALLLAAPPAGAQPAEQRPADRGFEETIDVNLVNLDVFVTDRKGSFIDGLTPADFTVELDGKKVGKLDYFELVEPGSLVQPGSPAAAGSTGGGGSAGAGEGSAATPGAAQAPLRLAVLVDNRNLAPANRNRVLGELRAFLLERAGPETEVLLMTDDGSLSVRLPFTSDAAAIGRALDEIEKLPAARFAREAERRNALDNMQNVIRMLAEQSSAGRDFAAAELDGLLRQIEFFAASAHSDVKATVSTLKAVVQALGALPGRKALIYVSDGLPVRPGDSLVTALQDTLRDGRSVEGLAFGDDGRAGGGGGEDLGGGSGSSPPPLSSQVASMRTELTPYDTSPLFTELVAFANARRVTFYPVNGAGGDIALLGAGERSDVGAAASPAGYLTADMTDLRDSLRLLAEETGGVALAGGTDVDGWLAKVEQDLERYYSLGFIAPGLDDGALHRVKVKVKGRGREVRTRQAFVARRPDTWRQDRTAAALLLGAGEDPLGLELEVEGQRAASEDAVEVAFLLRIPLADLGFAVAGGEAAVDLELTFASLGEQGVSPVASLPLTVRVPADRLDEARAQHYGARLPVRLAPGEHRVVFGLWDSSAGLSAYHVETVEVSAPAGS